MNEEIQKHKLILEICKSEYWKKKKKLDFWFLAKKCMLEEFIFFEI